MKQLPLTPKLKAMIQSAVGDEVDVSNFAVFESISLNDKPLPGKRGTLFEKAVVSGATLRLMVESINEGNTLPLMQDHNTRGEPFGRVFHAGLNYSEDGTTELRTLFYVDPTEEQLIAKLNNGTYDEVSVSFLAEHILCSECGWDYRGEDATWENLLDLTCANGHKLGEDGIHARLVGLEQFTELSLVARGAADNPKIVGKSQSKLAPETEQRLAAQGFKEFDRLVCQASLGEDKVADVDFNKLIADLSDARGELKVRDKTIEGLNGQITTLTASVETITGERDAAVTAKDEAETKLADAAKENKADEASAAVAYLGKVLKNVRIAAGKEEGDVPETVAELTAAIDEETSKLTAILPVNGVSRGAPNDDEDKDAAPRDYSAFRVNA